MLGVAAIEIVALVVVLLLLLLSIFFFCLLDWVLDDVLSC